MRAQETPFTSPTLPRTRTQLDEWIRTELGLSASRAEQLLSAIDEVFARQQRLWQESKEEAIRALSTGFADNLARMRAELSEKDATVSSIAKYFEELVGDLTERTHRDPKTKLMNFDWFMSQLESFLETEQRVRWSAIGLADIHDFKRFNDLLGHAIGDRIIDRVARLLREQIRSDDLIAQERGAFRRPDLHARFGGDEFCFFISDLGGEREARAVASRFTEAVAGHEWTRLDPGLAGHTVRVDVGVVCLWMGATTGRRLAARRLAAELIDQADKLMYLAKADAAGEAQLARMRIEGGRLREDRDAP
jgi:GGDEF domain-containing protein